MKRELELKDIAHYLPYGLKMTTTSKGRSAYINTIKRRLKNVEVLTPELLEVMLFLRRKPILRPLSDLTKEIEHNGEKFVPIDKLGSFCCEERKSKAIDALIRDCISGNLSYNSAQKLIEWHFDINNLIGQGLAIDINKLKTE